MGRSTLTRVAIETSIISFSTYDSDVTREMGLSDSSRQSFVHAQSCDCPYCKNLSNDSHPHHVSPLAAIDVYSLPDEATTYTGVSHV